MGSYDVKEMQRHLLELLKELHKVLTAHGLRYYLVGGTALGAARHHGFIPWDDDADIAMPRGDYEIFLRRAKEWLPDYLNLRSHISDPDYPFYYAKLEDLRTTIVEGPARPYVGGIFIDVFPIDGTPSSRKDQIKRHKTFRRYHKILHFLHRDPYKHGKGPRSWLPLLLHKYLTRQRAVAMINDYMSRIDFEQSDVVGAFSPNYTTFVDKRKIYGDGKLVKFEDTELRTLSDDDAYLRIQYGDYMQIPPENKRVRHNFKYVSYTEPYRNYRG